MGQQRARADEMNLVGASMGVELCVCVGGAIGQKQPKPCACVFAASIAACLSGLTELENELLSAFAHGSTLETTLGGMVCALDEDQVGGVCCSSCPPKFRGYLLNIM